MLARPRTFLSIVFRPIAVLFTLKNMLFIAKKPSEKESATIIRVLARAIKETWKSIKDSATLIKVLARPIKLN